MLTAPMLLDPTADRALAHHRAAVRARLAQSGLTRPGAGSISWTVNREVLVVAGWGRAILLQLAHPLVGAGVADHSRFRGGLRSGVRRLWSTVRAMRRLTFGSDDGAIDAAARINHIHDRVSGALGEAAGPFAAAARYSAHDADLLRWVHLTLVASLPLAFEHLVRPLTTDERDRYAAEAAILAPLLDIPWRSLPRSAAGVEACLDDMLAGGRVVVTSRARRLARAMLFPPGWRLCWPVFRPMQLLTIGTLPPTIRDAYGFVWTARDARALARWMRVVRVTRRLTPRVLREWRT